MDKRTALKVAKLYVEQVHRDYWVKQAYLFGSFARGNQHKDSDIDIAIILKGSFDEFDTQVDLMKYSRSIDLRIEPHPIAEKEFNKYDALSSEVLKYGIPIKLK
jgi:predicted nucleotidyltransferase